MNRSGRPAVFLDRDGTLIEDEGYLRDPSQLQWLPDTAAALSLLGEKFALFIVTNQPGVSRGELGLDDVGRVNEQVVRVLAEQGVRIEATYVCPHDRGERCSCVKPHPFFLHLAAREHGLDVTRSFVVGDHPHDVEFAINGGARGVYVLTGHGQRHRGELHPGAGPIVPGLPEAARWILAESEKGPVLGSVEAAASILRAGVPVAAPSANRFGRISPTQAGHVVEELGGAVDRVLDNGPCPVGVESTIVSVVGPQPALLRPGGIPVEEI